MTDFDTSAELHVHRFAQPSRHWGAIFAQLPNLDRSSGESMLGTIYCQLLALSDSRSVASPQGEVSTV